VGNFGSALEVLSQRATYFYVDESRYWYDTQASVTRTAQDHADRLREHPEAVWADLVDRLRRERGHRGDFHQMHICPEDTASVPDTEEAKLVVLHPQFAHTRGSTDSDALRFAQRCLDTHGSGQRVNRNAVVFLAPDARRMEELMDAGRDYLAWKDIATRADELNLTAQQRGLAERRRDQAGEAVGLRIVAAYTWALVPEQPVADRPAELHPLRAEGGQDRLADRVSAKLRQGGLLATAYGARNVRMDLDGPLQSVWQRGHVPVGELWSYYRRYPYLTRLRDRAVLDGAVRSVLNEITWEVEGFALAEGFDEQAARYVGLCIPHESGFGQITDTTLLVLPALARAQQQAERPPTPGDGDDPTVTVAAVAGPAPTDVTTAVPAPAVSTPAATNVRFFGVMRLNPERYGRDLTRVAQEVLQHLAAEGVDLDVTVEINATRRDGFPDDKVRIVTENARTLKFDQYGFEDS
jgi:hypothetical protein